MLWVLAGLFLMETFFHPLLNLEAQHWISFLSIILGWLGISILFAIHGIRLKNSPNRTCAILTVIVLIYTTWKILFVFFF